MKSSLSRVRTPTERTAARLAADPAAQQAMAQKWTDAPVHIVDNPRLREPQREGYLAAQGALAEDHRVAVILDLPTGAGKTGLLSLLPYGIAKGRVLVVTPSLSIKRGVGRTFVSCAFYAEYGVLEDRRWWPRTVLLEGQNQVNLGDLIQADVVVANIQQVEGWTSILPPNFFDLILVDETHHAPAKSWRNLSAQFPMAKRIGLTGTRARSDGQRIPGQLVYRYPLQIGRGSYRRTVTEHLVS